MRQYLLQLYRPATSKFAHGLSAIHVQLHPVDGDPVDTRHHIWDDAKTIGTIYWYTKPRSGGQSQVAWSDATGSNLPLPDGIPTEAIIQAAWAHCQETKRKAYNRILLVRAH